MTPTNRGFVALISVIIIGATLLGLTVTTGMSGFFARFDALDAESKKIAWQLARACVDAALLNVANEYDYSPIAGGDTVAVGTEHCIIVSVTYGSEDALHTKEAAIEVRAAYHNAFTNLLATATVINPAFLTPASVPVSVLSVQEI